MACALDISDEESFVEGFFESMSPYECFLLESVGDESLTYDLRVRAGCDV